MIKINYDKCIRCNKCVKVCADNIISEGPKIEESKNPYCIRCGHCFGICPNDAITIDTFGEAMPESASSIEYNKDYMLNLIKNRRSCRKYKDEEVNQEDLEKILEAVSYSPSASNSRAIKAHIYKDTSTLTEIKKSTSQFYSGLLKMLKFPGFSIVAPVLGYSRSELKRLIHGISNVSSFSEQSDPLFHKAKTLIVLTASKKDEMSIADGWIYAQTAILFGEAIGVSSCYIGYLSIAANRSKNVRASLNLPENEHVVSAFVMGYKDINFKNIPPRKSI